MIKKRLSAAALAAMMTLSSTSVYAASDFTDMPADYSTAALEAAIQNGLLNGAEGKILPNEALTRAQMAAILVRAFGATEVADLKVFRDVEAKAWYFNELAKAVRMGAFNGSGDQMRPNDPITRQEAFVVLSRVFALSAEDTSNLKEFADYDKIAPWACEGVSAMVSAGFVKGNGSGIAPLDQISRKDFAVTMDRMIETYVKQSGTYTELPDGSVMINQADVTLKDVTVKGNLIIGDGVGDGDVTLDNVKVEGNTVVRGGGMNSLIIKGKSSLHKVILAKIGGGIRFAVQDGAQVGNLTVAAGEKEVKIQGKIGSMTVAAQAPVLLDNASVDNLDVTAPNAQLTVGKGSNVLKLTVSADASGVKLSVEAKGKVGDLNIKAKGTLTAVSGKVDNVTMDGNASDSTLNVDKNGIVTKVESSADGLKIEGSGKVDNVTITGGLDVSISKDTDVGDVENQGDHNVDVGGETVKPDTNKPGGGSSGGGSSGGGGSGGGGGGIVVDTVIDEANTKLVSVLNKLTDGAPAEKLAQYVVVSFAKGSSLSNCKLTVDGVDVTEYFTPVTDDGSIVKWEVANLNPQTLVVTKGGVSKTVTLTAAQPAAQAAEAAAPAATGVAHTVYGPKLAFGTGNAAYMGAITSITVNGTAYTKHNLTAGDGCYTVNRDGGEITLSESGCTDTTTVVIKAAGYPDQTVVIEKTLTNTPALKADAAKPETKPETDPGVNKTAPAPTASAKGAINDWSLSFEDTAYLDAVSSASVNGTRYQKAGTPGKAGSVFVSTAEKKVILNSDKFDTTGKDNIVILYADGYQNQKVLLDKDGKIIDGKKPESTEKADANPLFGKDNGPDFFMANGPIYVWDYHLTNYDESGNIRYKPGKTTFNLGAEQTVIPYFTKDAILKNDPSGKPDTNRGQVQLMLYNQTAEEKAFVAGITDVDLVSAQEYNQNLNTQLEYTTEAGTYNSKAVLKINVRLGQTNLTTGGRYMLRVTSGGKGHLFPIHVVNETVPSMTVTGDQGYYGNEVHFRVKNMTYGITSPIYRVELKDTKGNVTELVKFDDWFLHGDLLVLYNTITNHFPVNGKYTVTVYSDGFQTFSAEYNHTGFGPGMAEQASSIPVDVPFDAISTASVGGGGSGGGGGDSEGGSKVMNGYLVVDSDLLVNAKILMELGIENAAAKGISDRWETMNHVYAFNEGKDKVYDFDHYYDTAIAARAVKDYLSFDEYTAGEQGAPKEDLNRPYGVKQILEDNLLGETTPFSDAASKPAADFKLTALEGETAVFTFDNKSAVGKAYVAALAGANTTVYLNQDSVPLAADKYAVDAAAGTLTLKNGVNPGKNGLEVRVEGYQTIRLSFDKPKNLEQNVGLTAKDFNKDANLPMEITCTGTHADPTKCDFLGKITSVKIKAPNGAEREVLLEGQSASGLGYTVKDNKLSIGVKIFDESWTATEKETFQNGVYTVTVVAADYGVQTVEVNVTGKSDPIAPVVPVDAPAVEDVQKLTNKIKVIFVNDTKSDFASKITAITVGGKTCTVDQDYTQPNELENFVGLNASLFTVGNVENKVTIQADGYNPASFSVYLDAEGNPFLSPIVDAPAYTVADAPADGKQVITFTDEAAGKTYLNAVKSITVKGKPVELSLECTIKNNVLSIKDTKFEVGDNAVVIKAAGYNDLTLTINKAAPEIAVPAMPAFTDKLPTEFDTIDLQITFKAPASKVEIHYTLDGSEPTKDSPVYGLNTVIKLTETTTVKAIAISTEDPAKMSGILEQVFTKKEIQAPAMPEFEKILGNNGVYQFSDDTMVVKFKGVNDPNVKIIYTDDETEPTLQNCRPYTSGGITINKTTTIKAVAYNTKDTSKVSGMVTGTFEKVVKVNAPTITPDGSAKFGLTGVEVALSADKGAQIYYTTDGTEPAANNGKLYDASFTLYKSTTVKAVAVKDGELSKVTTAVFNKDGSLSAEAPKVTSASKNYDRCNIVFEADAAYLNSVTSFEVNDQVTTYTISADTATIAYDGKDLKSDAENKVVIKAEGYKNLTVTLTKDGTLPVVKPDKPVFTVNGGIFNNKPYTVKFNLDGVPEDVIIKYSTSTVVPGLNMGMKYDDTVGISINDTTTIKAVAIRGDVASDVAEATFTYVQPSIDAPNVINVMEGTYKPVFSEIPVYSVNFGDGKNEYLTAIGKNATINVGGNALTKGITSGSATQRWAVDSTKQALVFTKDCFGNGTGTFTVTISGVAGYNNLTFTVENGALPKP